MQFRATIVSFDTPTHTAIIRLDGSAPQVLAGVATSRAIAPVEMTAGRRVILDAGDHGDFADLVVMAVYS